MNGQNGKPLILTVDDEPCISRVVQLKLERAGYAVEKAMTAEEGLAKIKALRPDVVITDVNMPGMSGIDLCRECEPLASEWEFLVIVLTSQMDEGNREWVERNEHRRFLSKPFSPKAILSMIDLYLANRSIAHA